MVKGIAIVLFRVLGVFFCLQGFLVLPWTIVGPSVMGEQFLQNVVFLSIYLISGLVLIIFSRAFAGMITPHVDGVPANEQPLNVERFVSAGTILIALYLLIIAIGSLVAPFLELLEFFLSKTVVMSQDHEEEFLTSGQSIFVRYDYVIDGIATLVLALIVLTMHPRIAKLARR